MRGWRSPWLQISFSSLLIGVTASSAPATDLWWTTVKSPEAWPSKSTLPVQQQQQQQIVVVDNRSRRLMDDDSTWSVGWPGYCWSNAISLGSEADGLTIEQCKATCEFMFGCNTVLYSTSDGACSLGSQKKVPSRSSCSEVDGLTTLWRPFPECRDESYDCSSGADNGKCMSDAFGFIPRCRRSCGACAEDPEAFLPWSWLASGTCGHQLGGAECKALAAVVGASGFARQESPTATASGASTPFGCMQNVLTGEVRYQPAASHSCSSMYRCLCRDEELPFDPADQLVSYIDKGACGVRGDDAAADVASICGAGSGTSRIVKKVESFWGNPVARLGGCDYLSYTIFECITTTTTTTTLPTVITVTSTSTLTTTSTITATTTSTRTTTTRTSTTRTTTTRTSTTVTRTTTRTKTRTTTSTTTTRTITSSTSTFTGTSTTKTTTTKTKTTTTTTGTTTTTTTTITKTTTTTSKTTTSTTKTTTTTTKTTTSTSRTTTSTTKTKTSTTTTKTSTTTTKTSTSTTTKTTTSTTHTHKPKPGMVIKATITTTTTTTLPPTETHTSTSTFTGTSTTSTTKTTTTKTTTSTVSTTTTTTKTTTTITSTTLTTTTTVTEPAVFVVGSATMEVADPQTFAHDDSIRANCAARIAKVVGVEARDVAVWLEASDGTTSRRLKASQTTRGKVVLHYEIRVKASPGPSVALAQKARDDAVKKVEKKLGGDSETRMKDVVKDALGEDKVGHYSPDIITVSRPTITETMPDWAQPPPLVPPELLARIVAGFGASLVIIGILALIVPTIQQGLEERRQRLEAEEEEEAEEGSDDDEQARETSRGKLLGSGGGGGGSSGAFEGDGDHHAVEEKGGADVGGVGAGVGVGGAGGQPVVVDEGEQSPPGASVSVSVDDGGTEDALLAADLVQGEADLEKNDHGHSQDQHSPSQPSASIVEIVTGWFQGLGALCSSGVHGSREEVPYVAASLEEPGDDADADDGSTALGGVSGVDNGDLDIGAAGAGAGAGAAAAATTPPSCSFAVTLDAEDDAERQRPQAEEASVDEENLTANEKRELLLLEEMGFSRKKALAALAASGWDTTQAMEKLFAASAAEEQAPPTSTPPRGSPLNSTTPAAATAASASTQSPAALTLASTPAPAPAPTPAFAAPSPTPPAAPPIAPPAASPAPVSAPASGAAASSSSATASSAAGLDAVQESSLQSLMEMGFTRLQATKALARTNWQLPEAMEVLFFAGGLEESGGGSGGGGGGSGGSGGGGGGGGGGGSSGSRSGGSGGGGSSSSASRAPAPASSSSTAAAPKSAAKAKAKATPAPAPERLTRDQEDAVAMLVSMGFAHNVVVEALKGADWDLTRASNHLLAG